MFDVEIPRKSQKFDFFIKDFYYFDEKYSYIHRHKEWEICYCRGDRGKYFINDTEYTISAGDVFIVNGNEYHQPIYDTLDNPGAIVIYFTPDFLGPDSYCQPWAPYFLNASQFKINRLGSQPEIEALIINLNQEFRSESPHSMHYCQAILSHLLSLISKHYEQRVETPVYTRSIAEVQKFHKVIDKIKSDLAEPIEYSQLYSMAGLSKSQFCLRFREVFGLSLQDYILKERVNRSLALLKGSHLNVTEIAFSCGFNSSSYFNRVFKILMHMTPLEYRRSFRTV